jgi:hypothetical protein
VTPPQPLTASPIQIHKPKLGGEHPHARHRHRADRPPSGAVEHLAQARAVVSPGLSRCVPVARGDRQRAQVNREQAAADRAQAARDREQAASDRRDAADDRDQRATDDLNAPETARKP